MADYQSHPISDALIRTLRIVLDSDDGEEEAGTTWYESGESGNKIYMGKFSSNDYVAAFRFKQAFIPGGAIVKKAVLRLRRNGQASNPTNLKIFGIKEESPNTFESDGSNRPSTRGKTTASADWDFTTAPGSGDNTGTEWIDSPDISSVIQELADQPEFDGKAIGIVIEPDAECPDNKLAPVWDVSGANGNEARLILTLGVRT